MRFAHQSVSEYLSQRRKGAKEEHCHFERREKSFLDPSHSLGMTGHGPVAQRLGALARAISESESVRLPGNLRAAQIFNYSSTEFAEFGVFLVKNSLLRVLRDSAVQSPSPYKERSCNAKLGTRNPKLSTDN